MLGISASVVVFVSSQNQPPNSRSTKLRRRRYHISTIDDSLEMFYLFRGIRDAVHLITFSRGTAFQPVEVAMSQRGLPTSPNWHDTFGNPKNLQAQPLAKHKQKDLTSRSQKKSIGIDINVAKASSSHDF